MGSMLPHVKMKIRINIRGIGLSFLGWWIICNVTFVFCNVNNNELQLEK
ncbi:hypothetical protein B4168_3699 [Anoxybacillus flavithermus]|nr:hypothetical protein B4168_3699 [Anoxybacillus flavithermus]